MKSRLAANSNPGSSSSSSFFKPEYRRSLAVVGTSGLLFGVGFADTIPAHSNGVIDCTNRIVTAAGKNATEQVTAIEAMAATGALICLSGDFVLDDLIQLNTDDGSTLNVVIHGYGEGSSIKNSGGVVFQSFYPTDNGWDLTIDNLKIKDSTYPVQGYNVYVKDSTFSANVGEAVFAEIDLEITNSTIEDNVTTEVTGAAYGYESVVVRDSIFSRNSGGVLYSGGPIAIFDSLFIENLSPITVANSNIYSSNSDVEVYDSTFSRNSNPGKSGGVIQGGHVAVEDSTFDGNSAADGGAIYARTSVDIINSTFVDNTASHEGGAIFAPEGPVYFCTFVNNLAPTPPEEPGDTPGNAIYKSGAEIFSLAGNIFAGNSPFPQLGVGAPVTATAFTDQGGNIFSTPAEPDISGTYSPVFDAILTSLFGTNSPALATYAPNTNGTQTIALGPGSPALNAVPDLAPYNLITLDQRGQTRSFPADAGAFQGFVIPTSTPNSTTPAALAKTGNENLFWSSLTSVSLLVFGTVVVAVTFRIRRHTSNL